MSSVTPHSSSDQKPPLTFEFTKRKRWADLLISELVDGILFVLSTSCTVLFCAPAITELLGWRNTDLIDHDLAELVIPDDLATFRADFDDALQGDGELLSYIHLKSNEAVLSSKPMLFEIKGHVHHAADDETGVNSCLFIMAKPYPSRNTAMLNTFIELKTENERLQRRVEELRAQLPASSGAGTSTDPIYATSSLPNLAGASTQKTSDTLSLQYPQDGKFAGRNSTSRNDAEPSIEGSRYSNSGTTEEDAEEGSKKKKAKKAHGTEQYVCIMCGRTDSPEWRKGPLGPKTLCNACGLRWAKQMRKFEEPLANEGDGGTV